MATPIPPPFKAQPLVPPLPDFHMFTKGPSPPFLNPLAQGVHHRGEQPGTQTPLPQLPQPSQLPHPLIPPYTIAAIPSGSQHDPATATATATATSPTAAAAAAAAATQPPPQPQQPPPALLPGRTPASAAAAVVPPDPHYLAMASRLASYYQQRCQAVARFQQQRCEAWAAAQRQRCRELTQAATVIVAWYIRDRVARRRRRRRRAFRRGLAARADRYASLSAVAAGYYHYGGGGGGQRGDSGRGITKKEAVRRWVMGVPSARGDGGGGDDGAREPPADKEEVDFDMDREAAADKDTQLFQVADNLIKSHLSRIEVPLLGLLSFDESESESEQEEQDLMMDYEDEAEGEGDEDEYEDEELCDEDEDENEDEDVDEQQPQGCSRDGMERDMASASKEAQLGTTAEGSRKLSRSSAS